LLLDDHREEWQERPSVERERFSAADVQQNSSGHRTMPGATHRHGAAAILHARPAVPILYWRFAHPLNMTHARVLIVDDEESIGLRRKSPLSGHEVETAPTPRSARRRDRHGPFDSA